MVIRVLAVEDSVTQAEVLRADLEQAGFEVTLVHRAQAALDLLQSESFDLLLSDVVMPHMDGYDLCRAVKASGNGSELPVILLTSLTDPLEVVKGLEAGADNFIRKPYQAEQLGHRLRTAAQSRAFRGTNRLQMGLRLSFLDREFHITAERQQVLDLFISTFEELVVTTREVRAREQELTALHASVNRRLAETQTERNRLSAVLGAVPVPVIVSDRDGNVTHLSDVGRHVLGPVVSAGTDADDTDHDGTAQSPVLLAIRQAAQRGDRVEMGHSFDLTIPGTGGQDVPVVLHARPILDAEGLAAGSVATLHLLGKVTHHDPVTGLPNGTALSQRVAEALVSANRGAALLLLTIDRVHLARGAGGADDTLLAGAARALRDAVARCSRQLPVDEILLAYLGGDEFGVALEDGVDHIEVARIAHTLRQAIATWSRTELGVSCTASVGAAAVGPGSGASELLAAARAALRHAQDSGGDAVRLFDSADSKEAVDRLRLEFELRAAIAAGAIYLDYQPEIDLATGGLVGFEALARWRHPRLGSVRPDIFIALAEEGHLIVPLGEQLLEQACRQARTWADAGLLAPHQAVAVNLSTLQLRGGLADEVLAVLARTGANPCSVVLEITETAAMADPDVTIAIIESLRGHGVRFALDDFGTGYSSLAYLSRLPFDQLKLDRSFVSRVTHNGPDATIAQTVIALGHSFGAKVLAEGVEEEAQAAVLRDLGCDQAQGYLFARPLSVRDATDVLVRGHLAPAGPPTQRSK